MGLIRTNQNVAIRIWNVYLDYTIRVCTYVYGYSLDVCMMYVCVNRYDADFVYVYSSSVHSIIYLKMIDSIPFILSCSNGTIPTRARRNGVCKIFKNIVRLIFSVRIDNSSSRPRPLAREVL